jgi:hypothetical protein
MVNDAQWRLAVLERDDYQCQAKVVRECPGGACHAHHRKLRRHCSKAERADTTNGVGVCLPCHDWIHAHFPEALELGLRIRASAAITPYRAC